MLSTIEPFALAQVMGAVAPAPPADNNAFGRCGPGKDWPILGNIYTPECAAHDGAVRGAEQAGTPKWLAHLEALPLLPGAVGSWVREKLRGK